MNEAPMASVRPRLCPSPAHRVTGIRAYLERAPGFALIETMVTLVLLAIGLMGLAGLQARAAQLEMEAYQRTQALLLAQDMADRLVANKASAAQYVGSDFGTGAFADCNGLHGFAFDRCAWSNAILGATERIGAIHVGTLLGGRGCIVANGANQYLVIVAWQGLAPTVAPGTDCGKNRYGAEARRRSVIVPVHLPALMGV